MFPPLWPLPLADATSSLVSSALYQAYVAVSADALDDRVQVSTTLDPFTAGTPTADISTGEKERVETPSEPLPPFFARRVGANLTCTAGKGPQQGKQQETNPQRCARPPHLSNFSGNAKMGSYLLQPTHSALDTPSGNTRVRMLSYIAPVCACAIQTK